MENNPITRDLLIGAILMVGGLIAIGEAANYLTAGSILAMIIGNNVIRAALKKL